MSANWQTCSLQCAGFVVLVWSYCRSPFSSFNLSGASGLEPSWVMLFIDIRMHLFISLSIFIFLLCRNDASHCDLFENVCPKLVLQCSFLTSRWCTELDRQMKKWVLEWLEHKLDSYHTLLSLEVFVSQRTVLACTTNNILWNFDLIVAIHYLSFSMTLFSFLLMVFGPPNHDGIDTDLCVWQREKAKSLLANVCVWQCIIYSY